MSTYSMGGDVRHRGGHGDEAMSTKYRVLSTGAATTPTQRPAALHAWRSALRALLLTLPVLLLFAFPSPACNIPVFRFALEYWKPEPYELFILHKGPLPESQRKLAS